MEKSARKELEAKIADALNELLRKENSTAASQMTKNVKSASKDLAKKFAKHFVVQENGLQQTPVSSVKHLSVKKNNKVTLTKPASNLSKPKKKLPAK